MSLCAMTETAPAPVIAPHVPVWPRTWETRTELMPHQETGVEKLAMSRVFALFMEMGTGKSRTAIELAHRRARKISRIIWYCPVSLKATIRHEILKHTDCSAADIYVCDDKTTEDTVPKDRLWHIVGIESMSSSPRIIHSVAGLMDSATMVIVDESTFIKGYASLRSQRITKLSEIAKYRAILTGTPITQGYVDLFSQMNFLSPLILGFKSFFAFAARHITYSERFKDQIVSYSGVKELTTKIEPYVYQVTKAQCLTLPKKLHEDFVCSLSDEQSERYEQAKLDFVDDVLRYESGDGLVGGHAIFRLFGRLQMICCGFDAKMEAGESLENSRIPLLQSVVGSLPDQHLVIWAKYHRSIDDIALALADDGRDIVRYDGRLLETVRERNLNFWRENGGILVATQSLGGHGLDLTKAHTSIFYSSSFKFSERLQAEDRFHRIGQTSPVTYLSLWADSGIDHRIQKALLTKGNALKTLRNEIEVIASAKLTKKEAQDRLTSLIKDL
jgi:SNF2 family DNA or RNA helicase